FGCAEWPIRSWDCFFYASERRPLRPWRALVERWLQFRRECFRHERFRRERVRRERLRPKRGGGERGKRAGQACGWGGRGGCGSRRRCIQPCVLGLWCRRCRGRRWSADVGPSGWLRTWWMSDRVARAPQNGKPQVPSRIITCSAKCGGGT